MYYPVGWPKVLKASRASKGKAVEVFRHRSKSLIVELRGRSVGFWHSRLCILVASYTRSSKCVEQHGHNTTAVLKPDGSALVVATDKGHLLFLRLSYEKREEAGERASLTTREHGIGHVEGAGDGVEVEAITIRYFHETAVVGGVKSLLGVGGQLMASSGYGVLHRLSWEGRFDRDLTTHLKHIPVANDMLADSKGPPLGEATTRAICYSPELHGLSLVLSDGRCLFLTSRTARYEPQSLLGVWLRGGSAGKPVCTAVNPRYRLIALGKDNGSVDIFAMDDVTGVWSLSHTLQFTKKLFPEMGVQLGAVECLDWSHSDGMVIAVSWQNGGLSLWTVFGSLLLCSLGDQPGTPSPLNPHCTILKSFCWSGDGYNLWMLPTNSGSGLLPPATPLKPDQSDSSSDSDYPTTPSQLHRGRHGNNVLVMRFVKNTVVNNPTIANHEHLVLHGSDRLYVNTTRGVVSHNTRELPDTVSKATANEAVSSPQWKVVQLPQSYLVSNWPVKYVAVSVPSLNMAVAGRAGFALYHAAKQRWKLFGNEVQEQSLVCRGGVVWYNDIIVFPCRVQERTEEIRFYSLHANLDNSQLLHSVKLTSPVVRLNLHGNHLILASRDCHMTIYGLNATLLPTKGLIVSVVKLHEVSLAKSLPVPWANTLVGIVPTNIRTEPASRTEGHRAVDSVLINNSGKLLMIQQDLPNPYQENQEEWCFSSPVCLATSVETVWTPPLLPSAGAETLPGQHIMESLWLCCGTEGIKVWLPLYPRDEGHPTFLSKRIMLTLPITVYPQAVLFREAVIFGLSHETAFTETSFSFKHSFPFATVERSTHVFLHHILRQLLRRNLGGHALHIARSSSHLPYFSHVLELMLHEVLEEEAPGNMAVPDALLPRVVEFIKQFPEFLETVGSCARKTEVALWHYLFAAVGNPRDLFELCISDGRLKIAASYLIIIQNLETSVVSRQLATRLLDAALDSNHWELCKDLVRFLRAIGAGDVDSPTNSLVVTPHKPHLHTPTLLHTPTPSTPATSLAATPGGTPPSSLSAPDLDRSAMSVTRDHLSSGSTSSIVSFSGEFRDAAGKVIRRPQFVMDVESKEEYFIELILCRHARKLLTACCLKDLGKFAAHLDFNLCNWLARERSRAARIEDFVATLRELHKQFQWPLPIPSSIEPPGFNSTSLSNDMEPKKASGLDSTLKMMKPLNLETKDFSLKTSHKDGTTPTNENFSPSSVTTTTSRDLNNSVGGGTPTEETNSLTSSLKRTNRPPDLDLTPAINLSLKSQSVTIGSSGKGASNLNAGGLQQGEYSQPRGAPSQMSSDVETTRSSTPLKNSGSVSERVSLILKQHSSSADLQDASSLRDILEESDWELGSDVAVTMSGLQKGSSQSEKELRYFIEVLLEAVCVEWVLLLGVLLLDTSVVARTVERVSHQGGMVDGAVVGRIEEGFEELLCWAQIECQGYLPFLTTMQAQFGQLKALLPPSPAANTPASALSSDKPSDGSGGVFLSDSLSLSGTPRKEMAASPSGQQDGGYTGCVLS